VVFRGASGFSGNQFHINKNRIIMEKYEKLMDFARKDWRQFILIANKIPTDKLEYQTLLSYLKSDDYDVRNGARMLLDKIPAELNNEAKQIVNLFE